MAAYKIFLFFFNLNALGFFLSFLKNIHYGHSETYSMGTPCQSTCNENSHICFLCSTCIKNIPLDLMIIVHFYNKLLCFRHLSERRFYLALYTEEVVKSKLFVVTTYAHKFLF